MRLCKAVGEACKASPGLAMANEAMGEACKASAGLNLPWEASKPSEASARPRRLHEASKASRGLRVEASGLNPGLEALHECEALVEASEASRIL